MLLPAIVNPRMELPYLLSRAEDFDFFGLIWCVEALRHGYGERVAAFINFPAELDGAGIDHDLAVRPWEMETLATLLILTPKTVIVPGQRVLRIRCQSYVTMLRTALMLRAIEGEEHREMFRDGERPGEVFLEMHRFCHQQFPWQSGFGRQHTLYKYLFLYAGGRCREYLERLFGVSIDHFINIAFWLYVLLSERPWAPIQPVNGLGASAEDFNRVMAVLSKDMTELHDFTLALVNQGPPGQRRRISYKRSFLRTFPIITDRQDGGRMIAPLPQLILNRVTSGLYFDLVGNQQLLNEANKRFEEYSGEVVHRYCPGLQPLEETRFGRRGFEQPTPDVLFLRAGTIEIVMECKAARLKFEAQFGDDPFADAEGGYKQIAKGIAQVWRFFGAVRTHAYDLHPVAPDAIGIVHTLDQWLQMSAELYVQCVAAARAIVQEEGWDVIEADMRNVIVCPSLELEDTLSISDEEMLLATFRRLQREDRWGWSAYNVRRELGNLPDNPKDFPFDMGDVMPWWRQHFEELARQGQ